MNEEPIKFPRANNPEYIGGIIKSNLENMGYKVQEIGITNNNCNVTTDTKVTEKDMSTIRMSVESKGYTIKFLPA